MTRRTTPVITGGRLRRCRSATGLQRITHVNGRLKMAIREAAPDLGPPLAPACRRASARVANVGGCDTAGAYADDRRPGDGPGADLPEPRLLRHPSRLRAGRGGEADLPDPPLPPEGRRVGGHHGVVRHPGRRPYGARGR